MVEVPYKPALSRQSILIAREDFPAPFPGAAFRGTEPGAASALLRPLPPANVHHPFRMQALARG